MEYPKDFLNKIICADCLGAMKYIPDNTIDTVLTDPPYGLEFMGKDWDNGVPGIVFWQEMFRIAKPGATLMSFGGTRTFHRLACAIEDAGWIIKDCIIWLYASGFPKATDISLMFDKDACLKELTKELGRKPTKEEFKKKWEGFRKVGKLKFKGGTQLGVMNDDSWRPKDVYENNSITSEAKLWNGWKSHGLKPSFEPILTCFKPFTMEQYFAIIIGEITNLIAKLCQISNVKDAEKIFSDTQAKLKKVLENTVQENAKTNFWENLENVRFVEGNSISKNVDSTIQSSKQDSVPSSVKENGKQDIIEKTEFPQQKMEDTGEKIIQRGEVENILIKIVDMSTCVIMENISLNTALLWKEISEDLLKVANTLTTKTATKLITGLRTLKYSLYPTTSKDIGNLSPNYRPILVAMKPNEGSYAENALKWKVSGLNIDGGRIGTNEKLKETKYPAGRAMCPGGGKRNTPEVKIIPNPQGRFPANLILECICDEVITEPTEIEDRKRTGGIWKTGGKETPMKTYKGGQQTHTNPECPCYMLDEQSGASSSSSSWRPPDKGGTGNTLTFPHKYGEDRGFNDTGGASRFFYIAKASRSERTHNRQIENQHPCIKPLKLMEYLCLLTKTPTGGIVLDPFAGSGTTLMAAKKQGRDFIGIEKEAEYVKIAEARLKAIPKSLF